MTSSVPRLKNSLRNLVLKIPLLLDGTHYDPEKMDTIRQRRIDYIEEMSEKTDWDTGDLSSKKLIPLLLLLLSLIKKRKIEYYVADGEADREIAALANHHKCPVVSSDSDFFIFDLKYGLIYFDRFCSERQINSFYDVRDFMEQFKLKKEFRRVIPVIFGNDFIKVGKNRHDFGPILSELSEYETCESYLATREETTRKNYEVTNSYQITTQQHKIQHLSTYLLDFIPV